MVLNNRGFSRYLFMRTIKRTVCSAFILFILFSSNAVADLYQWQDEKGDIHIVDDMLLVPARYRNKVKVLKEKPAVEIPPSQQKLDEEDVPQQPPAEEQEELYGDRPLRWWQTEFNIRKERTLELEKAIAEQKRYISIFEKGRGIGQIYSREDIEMYENYKKGLPDNEAELNRLKADIEDLLNRARASGVPKEIRE